MRDRAGPLRAAVPAAFVACVALSPHASAAASHLARQAPHGPAPSAGAVRVDRTGYVADGPVDPYFSDRTDLHVAVAAGRELARAFVRLAPNAIARNTRPSTLQLTLPVAATTTAPIAALAFSSPVIEACALRTTLPATVTTANAPAADCSHASAVGIENQAGTSWTFHLQRLAEYWRHHSDTGAVLLPISSTPTATWSTAFTVKAIAASVVRLPAARHVAPSSPQVATPHSQSAVTSSAGSAAAPTTAVGSVPLPTTGGTSSTPIRAAGVDPPDVAGATTTVRSQPVADAASTRSGVTRAWPWVLALCLLVALVAVGTAHRVRVAAEMKRAVPPLFAAYRQHPRSYGVASAALAWGLIFTAYAAVTSPTAPAKTDQTVAIQPGQSPQPGQAAAGGSTAAPGPGNTQVPSGGGRTSIAQPGGSGGTIPAGSGSGRHSSQPTPSPTTTEFGGKGTWRTIDGTRVFFPAGGGVPVADLYHGAADRIGISSKSITLCAHAALTFGPAFDIGAKDLNVYWDYLNAHGGIYGRAVNASYVNDNYDPGQAVQAAQTCKDRNTFFLLGGIGFDQIPAVRQWAEQNHELYLYHDAVEKGSAGLHYSFTALPSVEQLGEMFGQLDLRQFKGKKVGILYRQSPNWQPGSDAFQQVVKAGGGQVVAAYPVQNNQANYVQDLVQLHQHGAQVVFAWENAIATVEMLKQAQSLDYHPAWLVFPFNLETDTLGASAFSQPLYGVASWDAYDPDDLTGPFRPYAASMREFAREYHQYDPGANLAGDGGDLLYLNWEGQRFIAYLLNKCGPDCTRNRLAGMMLAGFHVDAPPECAINFDRDDHHHGGYELNILHVIRDPQGRPNWAPLSSCRTSY